MGVVALAAFLVVPFGVMLVQTLSSTGDQLRTVQAERAGVAYLRPLTKLVPALTRAQSEAVQGRQPTPAGIRRAMSEVAEADRRYAAQLGTEQRWTGLRQRLVEVTERSSPLGPKAYPAYAETTDQVLSLALHVAERSHLLTDGRADTHHLARTAYRELPGLMVSSGRFVDLVRLGSDSTDGEQDWQARVLTAQDRVSTAAMAVGDGLRRSLDTTDTALLSSDLVGFLDRVQDTAGQMAPVTPLVDLKPPAPADARRLEGARDALDGVLLELSGVVLGELDAILQARAAEIEGERTKAVVTTAVAGASSGWLLWMLLPQAPGTGRHRSDTALGGEPRGEKPTGDIQELVDARELIADDQLVHVGRAVRPVREERARESE
ncbi:hypothetical protein [Streptomyces sp. PSKA30]|uniref:hypothetical protein n=1 Tax=Streptomyces sp. PSKA30 TaxID=2874597 RepID=UPI001CD04686|nr:hypothetical protein [Streptomyces sp. PSKA30]MBZ9645427.1 hypothetical protein [Streptomyces sp. PSKA30]